MRGGVLATGVKFGPDGKLYLADWIEGWEPKGRGRIWTLDVPAAAANPARAEVKSLIAADFKSRSVADLVGLLGHADMRIRQKAQFELVDRNAAAELLAAARKNGNQLARIHGMWGLHQLAHARTRVRRVRSPSSSRTATPRSARRRRSCSAT